MGLRAFNEKVFKNYTGIPEMYPLKIKLELYKNECLIQLKIDKKKLISIVKVLSV